MREIFHDYDLPLQQQYLRIWKDNIEKIPFLSGGLSDEQEQTGPRFFVISDTGP